MVLSAVPDTYWSRLSPVIANAMGLHFPRERWRDLEHGLTGAALEFGFSDVTACADWLLSSPLTKTQLQVLASHLTIGETYFFRDPQTLEALAEHILPRLIRARCGGEQRLRIWSAACCSGEEPYTLAILLHRLLPDLADWHVTICATDINPRFLRKAAAGIYSEWSFRGAPPWLKTRYFSRTKDGHYAIIPEIRQLVSFAHLNLVADVYPSPVTDTNAMDLICCRNVLMYFTPPQIEKVVSKLRLALVDGGWLTVSPSEASSELFSRFVMASFSGAVLYQRNGATLRGEPQDAQASLHAAAEFVVPAFAAPPSLPPALQTTPSSALPAEQQMPAATLPTPYEVAESYFQQGHYAEAAYTLESSSVSHAPETRTLSLLVRALANQGKLADAQKWCDRWIAVDKTDPAGHYLRAVILQELGNPEQARFSLQRVLYLNPDFALAHYSLGMLERECGKTNAAARHFTNALDALRCHQPADLLPDSDGLTAGQLTDIIRSMTESENIA